MVHSASPHLSLVPKVRLRSAGAMDGRVGLMHSWASCAFFDLDAYLHQFPSIPDSRGFHPTPRGWRDSRDWALGPVLLAKPGLDLLADLGHGLLRHVDAVGPHVRDKP